MKKSMFIAVLLCLTMAISAQNIPPVVSPQKAKVVKVTTILAGRLSA